MKLYLDACAIIYAIEGTPSLRKAVIDEITDSVQSSSTVLFTSRLSRLECLVKPKRDKDRVLADTYEQFFVRSSLLLVEIGPSVIETALDLRVRYRLKSPDAIHLASAIEEDADLFLTGDASLVRCKDVRVEVIK